MPDEFDELLDELGEGAQPGVDSASSPVGVPERNQQGRDSDQVPAPALPEEEEVPPDPEPPSGQVLAPLPADLAAVWGTSLDSTLMAQRLIASWGLEKFRSSAIHMQAVKEQERDAKMETIRAAYIKAKAKERK